MGNYQTLEQIDRIILHCSDTPNGRYHSAEDIDVWHRHRGFKRNLLIAPEHRPELSAIGYHFVIRIDGRIESGRPLNESGAHTRGHNRGSIGICLIGRDQYSQQQWQALEQLIKLLEKQLGTELKVLGHNQLSNKTCPGFDVHRWMYEDFDEESKHTLCIATAYQPPDGVNYAMG